MQRCLDRLEELAAREPRMRRAVANVGADCRCDGNPHGNIPPAVQTAIGTDCAGPPPRDTESFPAVFARRRAIAEPAHYPKAPSPPDLRRCVSLTTFVAFHLTGRGYDALGSAAEVLDEFALTGPRRLPVAALRGSTGRLPNRPDEPPDPCWWSWHTREAGPPQDGETYLAELAMGEGECARARTDDRVVEVRLNPADLGEPLYKPSALDAFGPDSPFGPDLTEAPHGWTRPAREGLRPRPELVSRPVAYVKVAPGDDLVDLTIYPYRAPGLTP